MVFQSTPSKRRATIKYCFNYPGCHISIHALQAESDCSHLSINGATMLISIHALQAESDVDYPAKIKAAGLFQSTPSKRRATIHCVKCATELLFQSTPSKRRATLNYSYSCTIFKNFNPRPPSGERLGELLIKGAELVISIHALQAESDKLTTAKK